MTGEVQLEDVALERFVSRESAAACWDETYSNAARLLARVTPLATWRDCWASAGLTAGLYFFICVLFLFSSDEYAVVVSFDVVRDWQIVQIIYLSCK